MQRVVVDANVWVSATLKSESIPGIALRAIEDKVVQSVISRALVDQVLRTLRGFGLAEEEVLRIERNIIVWSEFGDPTFRLAVITAKESDNRVLECAVAGKADFIVTGDRKHLLRLGEYEGIPIISPREFVETVNS
ncbi:MAG: putative toxin-antitoxin system toxin component, PIN family [Thermomicrobiales bacterium]